jgi:hypothetical protein
VVDTDCDEGFLHELGELIHRAGEVLERVGSGLEDTPKPAPPPVPARVPTVIPSLQRNPVTMAFDLPDDKTATISPSTPILDAAGVTITAADGVTPATATELGVTIAWASSGPAVTVDASSGLLTPGQPITVNTPTTISGTGTLPSGGTVSVESQEVTVRAGAPTTIPTTIA